MEKHWWELCDLATPMSLHVAVTLRVAEAIEAGHTAIDALASACGADADALQRVLRHLVSNGVFEEPTPGTFALNDTARELLSEGARHGMDLDGFGGRMAYAWVTLLSAVRTGRAAYKEHFGLDYWDDLAAHPEIARQFDALMGPAGHGAPDPHVLVNDADWASIRTVVDVGGGTGSLLAEVLRTHPHVRGTLVDLPRVVAQSDAVFAAAGVSERAGAIAQSFFDPLPAGHDLYMTKSVLADWPDEEASILLRRLAEAARPRGRVVILGGVNPGEKASPELLMLVLVGGKDRTLTEFRAMAEAAGLAVRATGRQPSGRFIVECSPI